MRKPVWQQTTTSVEKEQEMVLMKTKWVIVLLLACLLTGVASAAVLTQSQFGAYGIPTGEPLGGGKGYSDIKTSGDCTATNATEFVACLGSVTSGQVVYIPETADINLTGIYTTGVKAGVTIASNRGSDGSAGGRIFQNRIATDPTRDENTAFLAATLNVTGDNVRITGLRIEGPDKTQTDYTPLNLGDKYGILNWGHYNLVVDNNEMWGWSWAAIAIRNASVPVSNATIKYNYIHHCQEYTNGYGVAPSKTSALILGNVFDYTAHAITGDGDAGETYNASYNVYLTNFGNKGQVFDVHQGSTTPLGGPYMFYHNTVKMNQYLSIRIREAPGQPATIQWNDFPLSALYPSNSVEQIHGTTNVSMSYNLVNNAYVPSGGVLID
jgi:hypothetical protein